MQKINRRATTQDLILKVLRRRKKPLTAKQIAEKIGKPHDATRHALNRMFHRGSTVAITENNKVRWVLDSLL